ncbi:hypothetical protein ABT124_39015 [Streptomyces sp. NPDC001982]|uniref:hypothetical protein n=1 Tax=Streptomyces sp. NPDC001982 TaxID=3154405 RepID=UPI003319867C
MAAPHVAGAAASLAQRHPDWSGQRSKAAPTACSKNSEGWQWTRGHPCGARPEAGGGRTGGLRRYRSDLPGMSKVVIAGADDGGVLPFLAETLSVAGPTVGAWRFHAKNARAFWLSRMQPRWASQLATTAGR